MFDLPSRRLFKCVLNFLTIIFAAAIPVSAIAQDLASQDFTENSLKANLSNLKELKFQSGVNNVFFRGIGKEGQITVAYTQYDSTGSHCLYLVTIKDDDQSPNPSWLTVPIGNNEDETIDDAPLDGELVGKSVRFFNGLIENKPATLLFVSTIEDPLERPGTAAISVQELQPDEAYPPYLFRPILEFETLTKYDNANDALLRELNIPLPNG